MLEIKLYPHQTEVLKQTEGKNHVAYYLDMGLGKTFVGSEKAVSFPQKILVVCQKSKIDDWIEHFKTYYDLTIFNLTKPRQIDEYINVIGKCVGIINYDLIWRRSKLGWITDFTLMLDESSLIQNEKSKRTKFIMRMYPENVILLSGTPTAGKYEKLWSQCRLLEWKISKNLYYNQFVEVGYIDDHRSGFRIPIVTGYKNVDRLKTKLRDHGVVFQKTEDVFDLPETVENRITCGITSQYKTFMKNRYIEIGKEKLIGDTTLTMRLWARVLCGAYSQIKRDCFEDLLNSTEDRLLVFYNFNRERDLLRKICDKHLRPISMVNGAVKDLSAYEQYSDSVTLIQYQTGAMGLNLQLANKVVYFTPPERSELFEQSKKRIHRIGQERTCFYYMLVTKNSIEEKIYATLKMRKDYTDELFREDFKVE